MKLVLLAAALPLCAQTGVHIDNAQIETRTAQPLEPAFRSILQAQSDPAWIGYTVPMVPKEGGGCHGTAVFLEGPSRMAVLFRIERRQVDRIRIATEDCPIDGGGLRFYLLTGVIPSESTSLLSGLLGDASGRIRDQALSAIARTNDPSAVPVLLRAAQQDKSSRVRGQALTWLAQRAARQISEAAIREAVDKDPETEAKKKAVYALTRIPRGEGIPLLIEIARTNRNAAVRKQAMFWLGQSKDPQAVKFFEEVLSAGR